MDHCLQFNPSNHLVFMIKVFSYVENGIFFFFVSTYPCTCSLDKVANHFRYCGFFAAISVFKIFLLWLRMDMGEQTQLYYQLIHVGFNI